MTPTFQGEMQLAGWQESHTSGAKLTFWLSDSADLDVFRGMTARKGHRAGQRFAVVLVEIGDDEQPVIPEIAPAPAPAIERPKGGDLARMAGMWCADPEFRDWSRTDSADHAADWIRDVCEVESRAELDNNAHAAQLFHRLVRIPFMAWRGGE